MTITSYLLVTNFNTLMLLCLINCWSAFRTVVFTLWSHDCYMSTHLLVIHSAPCSYIHLFSCRVPQGSCSSAHSEPSTRGLTRPHVHLLGGSYGRSSCEIAKWQSGGPALTGQQR